MATFARDPSNNQWAPLPAVGAPVGSANRIGGGGMSMAGPGYSSPAQGGPAAGAGGGNYGWVAPAIGGIATLGGALLGGGGSPGKDFRGSPLPFTQEMSGTMRDYGSLIGQYQRMGADPRSLGMAADLSNRQAALRGLTGPLAVGMANEAQSGVLRDFETQRGARLMQLMEARSMLGRQLQEDEARRRREMYENQNAAYAAKKGRNAGIGGALGTIGGAVLGSFVMPGLGTAGGAAAGGALGSTIGGWF